MDRLSYPQQQHVEELMERRLERFGSQLESERLRRESRRIEVTVFVILWTVAVISWTVALSR